MTVGQAANNAIWAFYGAAIIAKSDQHNWPETLLGAGALAFMAFVTGLVWIAKERAEKRLAKRFARKA